jgi:hypothetical protein
MVSFGFKRKRKVSLDSIISDHEEREARLDGAGASAAVEGSRGREQIGTVEQFFSRLMVAAVRLTGDLEVGDIIEIGTEEEAIRQKVTSMQIDRRDVDSAARGDDVGIKLKYAVDEGSSVYRITA